MEQKKILLDTNSCIEIVKDTQKGKEIIEKILDNPIFVSSVSVFELYLRETNINKIDFLLNKTDILNFDESSAKKASEIFKDLRKRGLITDYRDIFIASACIANNCSLLTLNNKHFEQIKELKLIK